MAILNWPTGAEFLPRVMRFGASMPKSAFAGFFTGQVQSVGHLADRLRCSLTLPPCGPDQGQAREAFFVEMASTGDWVRLRHLQRLDPLGTLRGAPTVAAAAATGARTLQITTTPGATLLAGDMLATGSQLLMTGYAGAVANGSGVLTMPLVLPLASPASSGAAVVWSQPTGTFALAGIDAMGVDYGKGRWQGALELSFVQAL